MKIIRRPSFIVLFLLWQTALVFAWTHGEAISACFTAFVVSGPSSGPAGAQSANFTVTLAGGASFDGVKQITISDGTTGGTITPSVGSAGLDSVTVVPTSGTSFTFTYSVPPGSSGASTLNFSNGWASFVSPSPVVYTSTAPLASRTFDLVNTIGFNTHMTFGGAYTTSNVIADLAFVGSNHVRDFGVGPSTQSIYSTIAAAGNTFDFLLFGDLTNCTNNADTYTAQNFNPIDTFITANPGAIDTVEGPNEVNNFPVCYINTQATSASTANGNAILHFAPTLASVVAVYQATFNGLSLASSVRVIDTTHPPASITDPGVTGATQTSGTNPVLAAPITINNANERLIFFIQASSGPVVSVSDTLGLTWSKRTSYVGGNFSAEEWTAEGPPSGAFPLADTVTMTQTGNSYMGVHTIGIAGALLNNPASPFDGAAVASSSGCTATSNCIPLSLNTTNNFTAVFASVSTFLPNPGPGPGFSQLSSNFYQVSEVAPFATPQTGISVASQDGNGLDPAVADAVVLASSPSVPSIASGTGITAATSTTVTMTGPASGPGVGSGDVIQFKVPYASTAAVIMWQQQFFTALHADVNLPGVKIINFTDFPPAGVAGSADFNNAHPYPTHCLQPFFQAPAGFAQANVVPGVPMMFTEDGYPNASSSITGSSDGCDQLTGARHLLNMVMDGWTMGVARTYFYEIIDEACDFTNIGNNYGAFDCSNNPKLSATAFHNFTTIMHDSGGTAKTFTPTTLNYNIPNLPPPLPDAATARTVAPFDLGSFSALFQKSNGTFEIAVWREAFDWDYRIPGEVTITPSSVTVNLGITATTVNVYDPVTGVSPSSTHSGVNSVTLSLSTDLLIVEVIP